MTELKVGGKYKICKKLGQGAFGILYQGYNLKTSEEVAMKLEKLMCDQPMLQYEAKVYEKLQNQPGFVNLHWFGVEGDFNIMVMDILGPSLDSLFRFCNYDFGHQTLFWIATQMISRIETMHQQNFIHRDIKPENFLIGNAKKSNTLFVIDFGLSKRYKCPKTGKHIQYKERSSPTGTLRYCSLNAHKCLEQSRRDDLESIGNILMYFSKGGYLPWMDYENHSINKQAKKKEEVDLDEFLADQPKCLLQYMKIVRNMEFEEKPKYNDLRALFDNTSIEMGYSPSDIEFEWIAVKNRTLKNKLMEEEEAKQRVLKLLTAKTQGKKRVNLQQKRQEELYQKQIEMEQQKEEKKRLKEQKKRQKMQEQEALREQKSTLMSTLQKEQRMAKITEKIEKAVRDVEISAIPKAKRKEIERNERLEQIKKETEASEAKSPKRIYNQNGKNFNSKDMLDMMGESEHQEDSASVKDPNAIASRENLKKVRINDENEQSEDNQ